MNELLVDCLGEEYLILYECHEAYLSFKVLTVIAWGADDENIRYFEASEGSAYVPTLDKSKANVFVSGDLRFDGCMNFRFDDQDHCALHTCYRTDAESIGVLLGRIYQLGEDTGVVTH